MLSRAQAAGPWSKTACCAVSGNVCDNFMCFDRNTASDFLFRLQPGEPQRFLPAGGAARFQDVGPKYWPTWGTGYDLSMGEGSFGGPGAGGYCNQGHTYAGSPNEACGGGTKTWGRTDLEAWYPVMKGV